MLHADAGSEFEVGTVEVERVPISYTLEGHGPHLVVLVHGFAAHSHWWDLVVPGLVSEHRILRVDLSGHGESGRRARYSIEMWASEVAAAQRAAFGDEPTLLVGHSLGGLVVATAACRPDVAVRSVLVLDTKFPDGQNAFLADTPKPVRRVYETEQAAVARFRLLPEQPLDEKALRHLGRQSVRRETDGWSWKHDHRLSPPLLPAAPLTELTVPLAIVYGEHSLVVDADMAAKAARLAGSGASLAMIPGAHHHIVLDSPLSVVEHIIGAERVRGNG